MTSMFSVSIHTRGDNDNTWSNKNWPMLMMLLILLMTKKEEVNQFATPADEYINGAAPLCLPPTFHITDIINTKSTMLHIIDKNTRRTATSATLIKRASVASEAWDGQATTIDRQCTSNNTFAPGKWILTKFHCGLCKRDFIELEESSKCSCYKPVICCFLFKKNVSVRQSFFSQFWVYTMGYRWYCWWYGFLHGSLA